MPDWGILQGKFSESGKPHGWRFHLNGGLQLLHSHSPCPHPAGPALLTSLLSPAFSPPPSHGSLNSPAFTFLFLNGSPWNIVSLGCYAYSPAYCSVDISGYSSNLICPLWWLTSGGTEMFYRIPASGWRHHTFRKSPFPKAIRNTGKNDHWLLKWAGGGWMSYLIVTQLWSLSPKINHQLQIEKVIF